MQTSAVYGSSVTGTSATGNSPLDKNAFLKLLITQLQNQDPMQPMEDKEFISQLAQFSSLEQMQEMNTNLSSVMGTQMLTQSTSWIGKAVVWTDSSGAMMGGQVKSVTFIDGEPNLLIPVRTQTVGANGVIKEQTTLTQVPVKNADSVFNVDDTDAMSFVLKTGGKEVRGLDFDSGTEVTGTVNGIEFRDGVALLDVRTSSGAKHIPLTTAHNVAAN